MISNRKFSEILINNKSYLSNDIIFEIDKYYNNEILYERLKLILKTEECCRLNIKKLKEYLECCFLLKNIKFIDYLKINDEIFKKIYEKHYEENFIEGKDGFVNMCKFDSMCLSWLMYLYH